MEADAIRRDASEADEVPPSPELRALYEQFEHAPTVDARQEIWNAIVAHKRNHEVRVGADAAARAEAVEQHKRRRLWPF